MKKLNYILSAITLAVSTVFLILGIWFIVKSKVEMGVGFIAVSVLIYLAVALIVFSRLKKNSEEKKSENRLAAFFTTKNITRISIFSALSLVLYLLFKFNLPFFPPWLDMQISDMPAMLAAFMMNPVAGAIVLLIKSLIKLPFTSTAGVGELADFLIGLAFILPAYFIYKHKKNIKNAVLGMAVGSICGTVVAMLANWFLLIPMYAKIFEGGWDALVGAVKFLFPNITKQTFYNYYIFLSVLPFNLLRFIFTSFVTFFLYKPLKRLFDSLVKNS